MEGIEGLIKYLMEIPMELKISIPLLAIAAFLKKIYPSLINCLYQPKLNIEFKMGNHFTFVKEGESDKHMEIPCFTIKNGTSKKIDIISNSIMLGNNRMPTGGGKIIHKLYKNGYSVKKIPNHQFIYEHYNIDNDHEDIVANRTSFSIEPNHTVMFPFAYFGSGPADSFCIKNIPKKSLLFRTKNMISMTLNINGKDYEYGLSKLSIYETYINFINGCESRDHIENYISMMIFHSTKINQFLAAINEGQGKLDPRQK